MPRSLAICVTILVGGCAFETDYAGVACSDGVCPSGLACVAGTCAVPDAGDAGPGDAPDARMAALVCADPGVLAGSGAVTGTTVGRSSTVAAQCGGFVMNGKDAVYRIAVAAGASLLVDIAGGRKAYVIATCPATTCVGNMVASAGNPIAVAPAAGPAFVIVDDENPALESTYTLTVTVN
jgi:hypothetical protein